MAESRRFTAPVSPLDAARYTGSVPSTKGRSNAFDEGAIAIRRVRRSVEGFHGTDASPIRRFESRLEKRGETSEEADPSPTRLWGRVGRDRPRRHNRSGALRADALRAEFSVKRARVSFSRHRREPTRRRPERAFSTVLRRLSDYHETRDARRATFFGWERARSSRLPPRVRFPVRGGPRAPSPRARPRVLRVGERRRAGTRRFPLRFRVCRGARPRRRRHHRRGRRDPRAADGAEARRKRQSTVTPSARDAVAAHPGCGVGVSVTVSVFVFVFVSVAARRARRAATESSPAIRKHPARYAPPGVSAVCPLGTVRRHSIDVFVTSRFFFLKKRACPGLGERAFAGGAVRVLSRHRPRAHLAAAAVRVPERRVVF